MSPRSRRRQSTSLESVLAAIARTAARLCEASDALIHLVEGDHHRLVAKQGKLVHFQQLGDRHAIRRDTPLGLAVLTRRPVHIRDIRAAVRGRFRGLAELGLFNSQIRTILIMPLLRDDVALGGIVIRRTRIRPFTGKQIALLESFAEQATIAIENVRLFTELQTRNRELTEALEQQTATAEILRVISSSPTNLQPVLDAISRSAAVVCGADDATVLLLEDGIVRVAAHYGPIARSVPEGRALARTFASGRSIVDRRPVHIRDIQGPDGDEFGQYRATAEQTGYRTLVAVPMLRGEEAIGSLSIRNREVRPFTDKQIALVKIFADQAVIAIENVRLFTELQTRNRALTEALEQQTATSEILQVISSSPTEPSRCSMPSSATRCGCAERFTGLSTAWTARSRTSSVTTTSQPKNWSRCRASTREISAAIPSRALLAGALRRRLRRSGHRPVRARVAEAARAVPDPRRSERPDGADAARCGDSGRHRRDPPRGWRLLAESGRAAEDLRRPGGHRRRERAAVQRAAAAHRRARPLRRAAPRPPRRGPGGELDARPGRRPAGHRGSRGPAGGNRGASIWEYDELTEVFHLRATNILDPQVAELLRASGIRKGEGALGRAALSRAPIQIPDVREAGAYEGPLRAALLQAGGGSVLTIPLLHEDRLLGGLTVSRRAIGEFPADVVALLTAFAAQSAIALQNARLFRELEAKSRELEVASRHKSQFLANMSHELRTPLNAILGYGELIVDGIYGEVPDRMREVLERVDASGRHLLGLINDVLDLSKIEAGQLVLALADYSMKEIVESVIASLDALAVEKGLTLAVDLAPGLPTGSGDQRRLIQVLLNLVGNAIKFTEEGGVGVQVVAAGPAFEVSVRDTGPGIAPADQARIFEEFQQADASTTRPKGGTGLGLAIARRIVALHGGRLWVESIAGRGRDVPVLHPGPRRAAGARLPERDLVSRRILVVDDHADNRRILRDLLGSAASRSWRP